MDEWPSVAFVPRLDANAASIDANDVQRAYAIAALWRDRRPADHALARHLLAEEIRYLKRTHVMDDAVRLAVLILGSFGDVTDIWLIWAAKCANGSTLIGLPNDLVCTRDVAATLAYVRASTHPERDDLLAFFSDIDGAALKEWQASLDAILADPAPFFPENRGFARDA